MSALRYVFLIFGVLVAVALGWVLSRDTKPILPSVAAYVPVSTDQPVTPIPSGLSLDARMVALGDKLFHDKRLSRDDSISCATCHAIDKSGHDGRAVAMGVGGQTGSLNSPTVFNSAFSFRQFWDGRAATLEEQAEGPIHNVIEMASNWREVMMKLRRDSTMADDFKRIWPDGMTPANIQRAIAEYERSLITPDSPFDRFLRGDQNAIGPEAKEGWRLFRDLGCIACHQGVNLGGNLYANLGIMGDYFTDRGRPLVKSDLGRYNVTGLEKDKHLFKVPTLRNIADTPPYFHDGSIATLEEAIRTMARYQLGILLNERDLRLLHAFLSSLSGQYRGRLE